MSKQTGERATKSDALVQAITTNEITLIRLHEEGMALLETQVKLLNRLQRLDYARWYLLNAGLDQRWVKQ